MPGMTVRVDGVSLAVSRVSAKPVASGFGMDSYLLYLGGFTDGEWLYEVTAEAALSDGTYKVEIVTEHLS